MRTVISLPDSHITPSRQNEQPQANVVDQQQTTGSTSKTSSSKASSASAGSAVMVDANVPLNEAPYYPVVVPTPTGNAHEGGITSEAYQPAVSTNGGSSSRTNSTSDDSTTVSSRHSEVSDEQTTNLRRYNPYDAAHPWVLVGKEKRMLAPGTRSPTSSSRRSTPRSPQSLCGSLNSSQQQQQRTSSNSMMPTAGLGSTPPPAGSAYYWNNTSNSDSGVTVVPKDRQQQGLAQFVSQSHQQPMPSQPPLPLPLPLMPPVRASPPLQFPLYAPPPTASAPVMMGAPIVPRSSSNVTGSLEEWDHTTTTTMTTTTAGSSRPSAIHSKVDSSCGSSSTLTPFTDSVIVVSPKPNSSPTCKHTALAEIASVQFLSTEAISRNYDDNAHTLAPALSQKKEALQRLFLGQLPYDATPKMVSDICLAVTGRAVVMCETITKRCPKSGELVATGCSHAYCRHEDVEDVLEIMNKRVLVDVGGIWLAKNDDAAGVLRNYVQRVKRDTTKRFPGLPLETVVAQRAISHYKSRASPSSARKEGPTGGSNSNSGRGAHSQHSRQQHQQNNKHDNSSSRIL